MEELRLTPIAHIQSDFPDKFGVPRQSGVVETLARVVFLPAYKQKEAFRGLEGFSFLWLLWGFSKVEPGRWAATVRPPRLGGNARMGVFATRSPFRPNPIGLSSVRLVKVEAEDGGVSLLVAGADLVNGTPIYDVKPYVPYTDSHPDASGGFADRFLDYALTVRFPPALLAKIPEDKREALLGVLGHDPRPSYQSDPHRRYGFGFAGFEVGFQVEGDALTVTDVERLP